jgi:hypothetical protein
MDFRNYTSNLTQAGQHLLSLWERRIQEVTGKEYVRRGHVKIRAVRCGKKGCRACPHAYYAYFVAFFPVSSSLYFRFKKIEKYLGVCDQFGNPRVK